MTQALATTMSTNIVQPMADTLQSFQQGVDNLLAKRSYFISQVLPKLKENQDYYEIKGRKSLAKGGAEKLASIYNLTATFERDDASMTAFSSIKDMIAYICNLYRGDQVVGQGRGAAVLSKNQGDVNRSLKMAQKSAFIDAVIRSTGLSDIFTQDIENMSEYSVSSRFETNNSAKGHNTQVYDKTPLKTASYPSDNASSDEFVGCSEKQKSLLYNLISQRYYEADDIDERYNAVDGLSKIEASQLINELLNT